MLSFSAPCTLDPCYHSRIGKSTTRLQL